VSGSRDRAPLVLVVDDDENARYLFEVVLQQAGYRVVHAVDGESGLVAFREHEPDLVVLDARLPGMSGFEVCRELRGGPRGSDIPVLMVTGDDDPESVRLGYAAGASDFVSKTLNWREFAQRVVRLMPPGPAAE
jgi:DNA-binding response OmpR family regulator